MSHEPSKQFAIKPVLRVVWKHLQPYRGVFFLMCAATIIAQILSSILIPYIGKIFIDTLSQSGSRELLYTSIVHVILLLIGTSILLRIFHHISIASEIYIETRVMAALEQSSFLYLLRHSYQFFQDQFSGSLVRKISHLSRGFEEISIQFRERLLGLVTSITGILIVLFLRNTLIGGLVLAWVIVMFTYNYLYTKWKISNDIERAAQDTRCSGFLADAFSNILTIKLFSGIQREATHFSKESNRLRDLRNTAWKLHTANYTVQGLILLVVQGVVLLISIRYWSKGQLSTGDIVLLQSYFAILNNSVLDFARAIRTLYTAFTDSNEMVSLLERPHSVVDQKGAKSLRAPKGEIVFDHTLFSYGNHDVLSNFDLKIASGEKIALVGSSGAGKSTVVKLLFRFYDITGGSITIDGQNIASVTQDSLREKIALVPQEPVLFHRSLMDNIRYGRPDATDKEVLKAAKLAHCHEFISGLPEKYETFVGERGVKLSGGERQRVAIARAILKDAPILVLDEATSSLDSESELLIQDALKVLMKGRTTIVIAHRLSTIMSMDRIVIMDQGHVADVGTHDDLVNREGIYQKLWNIQVGGFLQETE